MPDFEGKPYRKRGYYRALKRGDGWAVSISKKKGFDFLMAFHYRNIDFKSLLPTNIFSKIKMKKTWASSLLVVPFNVVEKK